MSQSQETSNALAKLWNATRCTGNYINEKYGVQHDGNTCPIHEGGMLTLTGDEASRIWRRIADDSLARFELLRERDELKAELATARLELERGAEALEAHARLMRTAARIAQTD